MGSEFCGETGGTCVAFEGTTLALLESGLFPLSPVRDKRRHYDRIYPNGIEFEPVSDVSESELAKFCEFALGHRKLLEGVFEINASMGLFSKQMTDDVASSIKKYQLCVSFGVSERSFEVLGDLINERSIDQWGNTRRHLFEETLRLAAKRSPEDWEEQINSMSDNGWGILRDSVRMSKESVAKAVRRIVRVENLDGVVVKAEVLDGVQDSDNKVAVVEKLVRAHNSSSLIGIWSQTS